MIRSGEGRGGGRPGRGREGKEGEGKGGEAAARPVRERPPTSRPPGRAPPRARADCSPGSARCFRAAAPGAPRFRVVRPQPRPRRGGGGRALRPRGDRGSPPSAPGPGALTFLPRERAGCEKAARVRTAKRFNCSLKGSRAPFAGKCPRRPRRGWGRGRLRVSDISGIPDASPQSGMPLRLTP